MSKYRKITTLGLAIVAAGFLLTEQSGAQDNGPDESVLVQPPAASPTDATPQQQPVVPPQTNGGVRRQPFMRPAQPVPATPDMSQPQSNGQGTLTEPMPVPDHMSVVVQPTPHISVDTDHDARRMYRRSGEVRLTMMVKNPADGCVYEIPMCIPGCCTDDPRMEAWCGIFGRGVVEYCWDCGFTATVKFRHILGDVKVEYEGD